jgi:hypothetical protein
MKNLLEISYVKHADINKILWDESLCKAKNALVYANSWFLDTVTNYNWDAIISADYKWIMPMPVKSKYGVKYLATPTFVQQLGIFGPEEPSKELIEQFIDLALQRISFVDFNFNWLNNVPENESFIRTQRTNLTLACGSPYDLLKLNFTENLTRNIQKSERARIRFSPCSIRNIIKLFQESKGKDLKVATTEWYNQIDQIYNVASLRFKGRCLGAYNEAGELLAGMFVTEWQGRATFLFSGNSEEGKMVAALPALINYYLKHIPNEIEIFDFEGSDNEGLKRFYKSFGSVESNYVHLKINRLPKYLRWLKA